MNTDVPTRPEPDDQLLAHDAHWRWTVVDDSQWRIGWETEREKTRHREFVEQHVEPDEKGLCLAPPILVDDEQRALTVEASTARPLSSIDWTEQPTPVIATIFDNLGTTLRQVHELRSPSGFGDGIAGNPFHTFNAFMAAHFTELSRRSQRLENEILRETAVESLAALRQELSAFHPHGKSTWTVGHLAPSRLAVQTKPAGLVALMDLGSTGLRPPEYDLAALHIYRLLDVVPAADRAFWRGYDAARTCDLRRRISYFERLIELERLLGSPSILVSQRPS